MPNLSTFGATEYMDGALSFDVVTELLMRGTSVVSSLPAHPLPTLPMGEEEEEVWSRRAECEPLEAVDFCGCVSAVFVAGVTQFVETFLQPSVEAHESRRARGRRNESTTTQHHHHRHPSDQQDIPHTPPFVSFETIRRLGLRGAKSLAASVLEPFVLAFTNLTDLDLSGTRCSPSLLYAIGARSSVRLRALALGRCPSLTGESIEWLLISGRSTHELKHLSLYGDFTFPSPLTEEQVSNVITMAPCFQSGKLEYLDLSSSPLTGLLLQQFKPQPKLRSLGLSYIASLDLRAINQFIIKKCKNVEIVTLINTSPQLLTPGCKGASLALHQQMIAPLAKSPFQFSLSASLMGEKQEILPPATNLRVIELSSNALAALGGGSDGWRIIRSKGGRGWYVDSRAGWVREVSISSSDGAGEDDDVKGIVGGGEGAKLMRGLPSGHPLRVEYERLADACGNVSSGVGWHARKMEVCCISILL
jgi:hypothetical protein